jgi:bifunctional non-homologous end joining protein LigD
VEVPFETVVAVAQEIHRVLDRLGAPCYCKTSGKRGLHVYIPLGARYSHEHAKQFAQLIASLIQRRLPDTTSLARDPAKRQQRVYPDYLQNGRGKTLATAYSARPIIGARVSTPLAWREVKRGLDPAKFTIRTVPKRLDKVGDLWQGVLGPGIDLSVCLERMTSLFGKL